MHLRLYLQFLCTRRVESCANFEIIHRCRRREANRHCERVKNPVVELNMTTFLSRVVGEQAITSFLVLIGLTLGVSLAAAANPLPADAVPSPTAAVPHTERFTTQRMSDVRYVHPIAPGQVTRRFDRLERNWHRGHRGVDLAAVPGTDVRSAADGVVYFSGKVNHQLSVSILHADGIRTTYGPLEEVTVQKGQQLRRGSIIGRLSPPTDQHPEPGLHWGAIRGKTYLNPLDLLAPRPIVLKPASPQNRAG